MRLLGLVIFVFFVASLPAGAAEKAEETGSGDAPEEPIVIKSEQLQMDNAKRMVIFTGEVNAKRDDMTIDCGRMVVFYKDSPGEEEAGGGGGGSIDRIVAEGGVKIQRADGSSATAERAVYYQDREVAVLTGNPVVRQGNDLVEGDKITIFFKENRSIVTGSEQTRVKAVIFPGKEKK